MDNVRVKAYKEASQMIALMSSEYGAELKDRYPKIYELAKKVVNDYKGDFMSYQLAESPTFQSQMDVIEEISEALQYEELSDYETRMRLKASLDEETMRLQSQIGWNPKAFFDNYLLNCVSKQTDEKADITNNPRFKLWFEGSKVVNDDKKPLIVYHGTAKSPSEFNEFNFDIFPAMYFAENRSYSEWFANLKAGGIKILLECYVRITNPLDLSMFGVTEIPYDEMVDYIQSRYGYKLPDSPSLRAMADRFGGRMWAWRYWRNGADWINYIKRRKEFDGIIFYENNPEDLLPSGEQNTTKAFLIFEQNQVKTADARNRTYSLVDTAFTRKKGGLI